MRRFVIALLGALALLAAALPVRAGESPVVVELFTSQGCNSCPAADAFLARLMKRQDVLALSLHVDYWDYLGWKDTFASPDHTQRQRSYARAAGRRTLHTPEMVIGGEHHAIGADPNEVERAIANLRAKPGDRLTVSFSRDNPDYVTATIDGSDAVRGRAAVYLFRYDTHQEVDIKRGENAGKTLAYHNVVREVRRLDTWRGESLSIMLPVKDLKAGGRNGCAIVVQREYDGPVLGAAKLALAD